MFGNTIRGLSRNGVKNYSKRGRYGRISPCSTAESTITVWPGTQIKECSSAIHSASRPVQPSGSSALSRPRKCSIMARPMVPFPLAFDSARSVLAVKGHASVAGIGLKRDTVHDTFMALSSRTKRYGDSMNEMTPAV